ncbi:MAG: DsbE family thiol:disulfide interchange protein [Burkholderiaceae bacterium]
MRLLKFLVPLALFAAISVFLYKGLSNDPRLIPSPLVGKPVPSFELPRLGAEGNWGPQALRGKVWLLNVWGSWCAACVVEHPLFIELARNKQLTLVGLAWKDKPQASLAWLRRYDNPYDIVVSDLPGTVAIDLGVYGAPESFLIDKAGNIRFKQVGPFTPEIVAQTLLPLVAQLEKE